MILLDPKNDYIFKRLFATAPHLLSALINAVRHEEEPVEVIEVLNPRIEPEELAGKFIVLDVLARGRQGQLFNIEMQVRRFDLWSARSAYYLASTLAKQLGNGQDYHLINLSSESTCLISTFSWRRSKCSRHTGVLSCATAGNLPPDLVQNWN
jgi:predicted transposase/invertase (TIGR01784 family)